MRNHRLAGGRLNAAQRADLDARCQCHDQTYCPCVAVSQSGQVCDILDRKQINGVCAMFEQWCTR